MILFSDCLKLRCKVAFRREKLSQKTADIGASLQSPYIYSSLFVVIIWEDGNKIFLAFEDVQTDVKILVNQFLYTAKFSREILTLTFAYLKYKSGWFSPLLWSTNEVLSGSVLSLKYIGIFHLICFHCITYQDSILWTNLLILRLHFNTFYARAEHSSDRKHLYHSFVSCILCLFQN